MTVATRTRPHAGPGAGGVTIAYYLFVVVLGALSTLLAPTPCLPTVVVAAAVWAGVSALLRLRGRTLANGFALTVTSALAVRNYAGLGVEARLWAATVLGLLAVPLVVTPLRRLRAFPFLHIWCVLEGIYVFTSALVSVPLVQHMSLYAPDVRTTGYRLLALFTAVLVGSGTLALILSGARGPRQDEPERVGATSTGRAYTLMVGGAGSLLLVAALGLRSRLGQVTTLVEAVAFAGGVVLTVMWFEGRLAFRQKALLVVVSAVLAVNGLGSGALYEGAVPGLLLLALWITRRRQVPWLAVFLAIVLMVLLNVSKSDFRQATRYSTDVRGSTLDLGLTYLDRSASTLGRGGDRAIFNSANRFANSDLLGYVATNVPHRYPYYGYAPYTRLPSLFVPRVLLSTKGAYNITNEFGRSYGLLAASDRQTSVNTPLHVEAYLAGGTWLLVAVALLSGLFMTFVGRYLRRLDPVNVVVGVVAAQQVMSTVESGILGFALVLPFIWLLRPAVRWAFGHQRRTPVVTAS